MASRRQGSQLRWSDLLPEHPALDRVPGHQQRCDLKTIKDFLGHADQRTTNRYAHFLTSSLANIWERPQGPEASPNPPELPKPAEVIDLKSRRKFTRQSLAD